MAAAEKVRRPETRRNRPERFDAEVSIKVRDDNSLTNERAERMALFMAEGIEASQAWKMVGGALSGGSWKYRKKIEAHPAFIERLAKLNLEREELMVDDLFGEAKWMANQMWREARATNNVQLMTKAAEMRMKIVEKEDARRPADAPQAAARPGKPSVDNPQVSGAMTDLKQRLIERGAPVPGQVQQPVAAIADVGVRIAPLGPRAVDALEDPDFMARLERAVPA